MDCRKAAAPHKGQAVDDCMPADIKTWKRRGQSVPQPGDAMIRPIRVAVVGCGRVSRTAHYAAIKGNPDFEFAAVCDIDRARADEWGRKNNVRAYYDLDAMLAEEKLDLVSINVPNGLHPRLARKAAERGVHILCEKPLGMRLDEVDALIALCEAKGVRLFTVLQNRFNATNLLLKRAVDRGRFGRLLMVNVTLRWNRSLNYYTEDNGWRGNPELAGGVFTNQAVHYIDTMQWLAGSPPESCYARMNTAIHPIEVETHGSAVITFRNGVIGSLNLICINFPDDREGSITLLGEHGTVRVGGKSMNKILEWDFAVPDAEDDALARKADYEPPTVYGFGHEEMYRRVATLLRIGKGAADVPDGREGRKSVVLLDGLYASARIGEPFRFPADG
jgi:UDP-N-acetyl-2-amino-2-deoxyglucuronate dehydrogenase